MQFKIGSVVWVADPFGGASEYKIIDQGLDEYTVIGINGLTKQVNLKHLLTKDKLPLFNAKLFLEYLGPPIEQLQLFPHSIWYLSNGNICNDVCGVYFEVNYFEQIKHHFNVIPRPTL